jgi:hypothetical protein
LEVALRYSLEVAGSMADSADHPADSISAGSMLADLWVDSKELAATVVVAEAGSKELVATVVVAEAAEAEQDYL